MPPPASALMATYVLFTLMPPSEAGVADFTAAGATEIQRAAAPPVPPAEECVLVGDLRVALSLAAAIHRLELPSVSTTLGAESLRRYELVAAAMQLMRCEDVDLGIACAVAAHDLGNGAMAAGRLRVAILVRIAFVFDEAPRPTLAPYHVRAAGVQLVPIAPEFAAATTAESSPLSWIDGQPTMIATMGGGELHRGSVLDEWRAALDGRTRRDLRAVAADRGWGEILNFLIREIEPGDPAVDEDIWDCPPPTVDGGHGP